MSSSIFAPSSTRLGAEWSRPEGADLSEEWAFARRVHSPSWQSSVPLVVGTLFGLALVVTALAAPPTISVRQMLAAESERAIAAAEVDSSAVGTDYSLPAHWQPALSSPSASDGPFACDPASSAFTC